MNHKLKTRIARITRILSVSAIIILSDPLHYDVRLHWLLCCRDKIFACFWHLFPPVHFQQFFAFYGILSKLFPLILFWYPNSNKIRNITCYSAYRITRNRINVNKIKCTKVSIKKIYLSKKIHLYIDNCKV